MSNTNIGLIQGDEEKYNDSQTGAIDFTVNPDKPFRLLSVSLHVSAKPTVSGKITISTVSSTGVEFNTIVDTQDMLNEQDFYNDEYKNLDFGVPDGINITYPNEDGFTCGLEVKIKGE